MDGDDRRDLPESAPRGIVLAGRIADLGRAKGGMSANLHAIIDANDRPLSFVMAAGQVSEYTGAAALPTIWPKPNGFSQPPVRHRLVQLRSAGEEYPTSNPGRRSRNQAIRYDKRRYRQRSRVEIMFGRLKDRRHVATRYDCCPAAFVSAGILAVTAIL